MRSNPRPDDLVSVMADTIAKKDPFALPSNEALGEIERKQNERAKEIRERRMRELKDVAGADGNEERNKAAEMIQRNYRGHRERRALKGFGLDSGSRWMEVSFLFVSFGRYLMDADFVFLGFEGW